MNLGEASDFVVARAGGLLVLRDQLCLSVVSNKEQRDSIFSKATVAGVYAAKRASEMLPLCHRKNLVKIDINIDLLEDEDSPRPAAKNLNFPLQLRLSKKLSLPHTAPRSSLVRSPELMCARLKAQIQRIRRAKESFRALELSRLNEMKASQIKERPSLCQSLKVRASLYAEGEQPLMESFYATAVTLLSLYEVLRGFASTREGLSITKLCLDS